MWGRGCTSTPGSRSSASSRPGLRARTACLRTCLRWANKRMRNAECEVRNRGGGAHLLLCVAFVALLASCSRDHRTPLVIYSPHGRDLLTLFQRRFEQLPPDVVV